VQLQHIDTVQNRLEISKKDWWIIIAAFVISRVVLYSVGYLGAVHYNAVVQHIAPFTFTNFVTEHVWDQFCQFDCAWFKNIAISGYDYYPHALTTGHAANWAFFPLFPIVGGWIAQFLGTEPLYGFYILSNLGSFTSLVFFYLCLRQLGHDQDNARYGIWLLAFSPYCVYFLAPYTESLFMTFTMILFLFAYRQQWFWVALAGMLMTATRNLGVMSVFSVAILAIQAYGWRELLRFREHTFHVLMTIWVIPLAMFGFMLYLYIHTGDAFAYKDIQLAWTRAIGNPFDYWWDGFGDGGRKFYMSAAVSVGWLMNIYLFAKKRWAEAVFMLLCTFIPLSTSNNAFPRYLFGLYPTMLVLLMLVKGRPNLRALLLALSAIMSCFGVIAWVNSLFFMA
jgi:hypothetical protein